jgi:hypothetical protein
MTPSHELFASDGSAFFISIQIKLTFIKQMTC